MTISRNFLMVDNISLTILLHLYDMMYNNSHMICKYDEGRISSMGLQSSKSAGPLSHTQLVRELLTGY